MKTPEDLEDVADGIDHFRDALSDAVRDDVLMAEETHEHAQPQEVEELKSTTRSQTRRALPHPVVC